MKILMTGSTGFLGSHLTRALVSEGHEVIIIKRSFSDTWRISDILSKVVVYNIDHCSLENPFEKCGPIDVVIHTATKYDRNGESQSQLLNSNVSFPLQLLEIAISYQTKMFINTDSFINKNNLGYKYLVGYALSKKQFLEWGKKISLTGKIRFINIKLEHIYGSFDNEDKFTTYIIKSCLKNIPELHLTEGFQKRDFIHVNDVLTAYSLILNKNMNGLPGFQEYELGLGESVTIREFIELIHKKSQSKTLLKFGAIPQRDNEIMESKANIQELKKLGWKSKINLEQGIELVLKDEKNRSNL
ncbi:epimerase [Alkalihalophilus pseudofirmus]|nr:epimerase [Alkalihalophilus pseudofirmus]